MKKYWSIEDNKLDSFQNFQLVIFKLLFFEIVERFTTMINGKSQLSNLPQKI